MSFFDPKFLSLFYKPFFLLLCSLSNYELYTMVSITKLCCRAENPGTEIGSPGNLQGINTGVVLLHLAKLRESNRFNKYLEVQEIDRVCQKFNFKGFIGDQVSDISEEHSAVCSNICEGLVEPGSVGQSTPGALLALYLQLSDYHTA